MVFLDGTLIVLARSMRYSMRPLRPYKGSFQRMIEGFFGIILRSPRCWEI